MPKSPEEQSRGIPEEQPPQESEAMNEQKEAIGRALEILQRMRESHRFTKPKGEREEIQALDEACSAIEAGDSSKACELLFNYWDQLRYAADNVGYNPGPGYAKDPSWRDDTPTSYYESSSRTLVLNAADAWANEISKLLVALGSKQMKERGEAVDKYRSKSK